MAYNLHFNEQSKRPHCVTEKVLDCDVIVNEFETLSYYYVQFRTNTLGKGARGVMVIVVGNGHGDSSSNPGRE